MQTFVNTEVSSEGVARVTFFHPAQNAMPSAILGELAHHITAAGQNSAVKIIILQSGGDRTFCAGASFDELAALETPQQGHTFFTGFARVINACRICSVVILGRVQGKAVGGGVGLAAATDYCFATQHAAIKLSELAVGLGPFVIGPAVERKIGLTAYTAMSLDPTTFFSAQWAQEKGLYTQVFESITDMDSALQQFAQKLASYNPDALKALKQVFWEGTAHWETLLDERAAMSGKLVTSEFTKKAIEQFKNGQ